MRKKRRQTRRRRAGLKALAVVLLLIALAVVMVWKVFVVKSVDVVGNEIYDDKKIEKWVLNDEYSWNSIYVYMKYKFVKLDEIPFVDSIKVTMKSPSKLQFEVEEKGVLGYLYVPSLGQNAYFDKDGFVVEISGDEIDGATKISGLQPEDVTLYNKLNLENSGVLKTLLSVTQLLKKYERVPSTILVDEYAIILCYDGIQVNLGTGTNVSEKILCMDQILPQLEGKTGTLHLETWTEDNTDVYFKLNELKDIPVDVKPETEETSEPAAEETKTEETQTEEKTDESGSEGEDSNEGESEPDNQ